MQFILDPSIADKIRKMKERVRWQDPLIVKQQIDQTRFVLDDGTADSPEFSFLVVGDSGSGRHWGYNPQRQLAKLMVANRDNCRFLLHTGDVVYLVGSREYYQDNFIKPYQEFLVGGEDPKSIAYDQMIFNLPILPVPGNHDYYDLPIVFGLMAKAAWPLRKLLRSQIDLDIGWRGSHQGRTYAKAFLDYLQGFQNKEELVRHLDRHYTGETDTGRCLRYQPGRYTRLPNRYYTFRYGGIDFFALDSNTFNAPLPIPATPEGEAFRRLQEKRREELDLEKLRILEISDTLNPNNPGEAEQLDDLETQLEQIEEMTLDINKQLASNRETVIDIEQLDWLRQRLIESWNTKEVRGRILYFHHPPYVTETTKWDQAQTLAVRHHLRQALDGVAEAVGSLAEDRGIVDLVLCGHAHCLEYLRTVDTGHADSHLHWIICGGSGYSLRRQRSEGPNLMEPFGLSANASTHLVAKSQFFIGRHGHGSKKRRPYSFLRINVRDGRPPKFQVQPFIGERFQGQWSDRYMEPFLI
ncbi:MAG TPA: metallophosphoesterase [Cyanobacteria bacterium UBA8803]|nr:metallophosphoesterase [Cyanobacteria bacterium UBA9273]HBL61830.1 metallophosphoesterase [Cyanobacteria bacterium UBA8803]